MKTKVVLLNGPIKCGKGFSINYMLDNSDLDLEIVSCKNHLHELMMKFFNVDVFRYLRIYSDRGLKEKPLEEFKITVDVFEQPRFFSTPGLPSSDDCLLQGSFREDGSYVVNLSIRQAMIYVSEVICKPRFGSDYFGGIRAKTVAEQGGLFIDDSASAFMVNGEIVCDEVTPLIEEIGQENIMLIRIHREGFTFEGDSREYIPDGVVDNTVDIYNVDEEDFYKEVMNTVKSFVGEDV